MLQTNIKIDDYYSETLVARNGMCSQAPFLISGQGPEPIFAWSEEQRRFTDELTGYTLYLSQNTTYKGKHYVQNPIAVSFDGMSKSEATSFKFGDTVTVTRLRGYYSRKRKQFRWKADGLKKESE